MAAPFEGQDEPAALGADGLASRDSRGPEHERVRARTSMLDEDGDTFFEDEQDDYDLFEGVMAADEPDGAWAEPDTEPYEALVEAQIEHDLRQGKSGGVKRQLTPSAGSAPEDPEPKRPRLETEVVSATSSSSSDNSPVLPGPLPIRSPGSSSEAREDVVHQIPDGERQASVGQSGSGPSPGPGLSEENSTRPRTRLVSKMAPFLCYPYSDSRVAPGVDTQNSGQDSSSQSAPLQTEMIDGNTRREAGKGVLRAVELKIARDRAKSILEKSLQRGPTNDEIKAKMKEVSQTLKGVRKARAYNEYLSSDSLSDIQKTAVRAWLVWWNDYKAKCDKDRIGPRLFRLRGRWSIQTYHNDEWVFAAPTDVEIQPYRSGRDEQEALQEWCKHQPPIRKLWARLCTGVCGIRKEISLTGTTLALEICLKTWAEQHVVRLHAHLVLDFKYVQDRTDLLFLKLEGVMPTDIQNDESSPFLNNAGKRRSGKRGQKSDCCHYYSQIPKRGSLWTSTDRPAHTQFHVKPSWILQLVENDKITVALAKDEYVLTCNDVQRNVANMDVILAARESRTIRSHQLAIRRELNAKVLPMRVPRGKDSFGRDVPWWKSQYRVNEERYLILVLCGRSRTGKTMWARRAFGNDTKKCYEVNCSAGHEPNMRGLRYAYHKWCLLDECSPKQILHNRKFFQAQDESVVLGTSPTGCHQYECYAHCLPFIVCSNDWIEDVANLEKASEREWISRNCVTIVVDEELFG